MRVLAVDDDNACDSVFTGQKTPSTSEGKTLGAKVGVGD